MKILYGTEYFGRELYIIEIDGKIIEIYKSSGSSGTGHTDMYLPFGGIEKVQRITSVQGYIYKEYLYDGVWTNHRKEVNSETNEKVNAIADFIKSQKYDLNPCDYENFEYTDMSDFIIKVYNEMSKITSGRDYFDYKLSKNIVL